MYRDALPRRAEMGRPPVSFGQTRNIASLCSNRQSACFVDDRAELLSALIGRPGVIASHSSNLVAKVHAISSVSWHIGPSDVFNQIYDQIFDPAFFVKFIQNLKRLIGNTLALVLIFQIIRAFLFEI
jgi:hypothetical protein